MAQSYDVVVIGAGPAGYIAAIRAAQLGFRRRASSSGRRPGGERALGGTCLNVGCIPSKALLESSEHYERARHKLGAHGIAMSGVQFDLAKMLARKTRSCAR
jgi:dihydrolipoamide dehydrogenase